MNFLWSRSLREEELLHLSKRHPGTMLAPCEEESCPLHDAKPLLSEHDAGKPLEPPRPTGVLQEMSTLDGMLMFAHGRPGSPGKIAPLQIQGGPLAVLVFSTLETLARFESEFPELVTGRIVKIDDTRLFFEDIPLHVSVALDVRKTERGTVRYFDVSRMR